MESTCPIRSSTWYEALAYANWLSGHAGFDPCFRLERCAPVSTGESYGDSCDVELLAPNAYECQGYRLPTSAEWEFAARAGTTTEYYSGPMSNFEHNDWCNWDPNLVRVAWYCANVPKMQAQPVGQLLPNSWGLFDILGNVNSWTLDRYQGLPLVSPTVDPAAALDTAGAAVFRGCQVFSQHHYCRAAASLSGSRDARHAGLRLVRTLGPGTLPTLDDVPPENRAGAE